MADIQDIIAGFDASTEHDIGSIYVLVGGESLMVDRAFNQLRAACAPFTAGFNEELFAGKGLTGDRVTTAARTLPMMGTKRFVGVRGVDAMAAAEQTALARYLEAPSGTTCLVLTAEKLDGRGALAKAAKAQNVIYQARPPRGSDFIRFAQQEATAGQHELSAEAASALVDSVGEDLSAISDAVERLSLFVGTGQPITEQAIEQAVARVRTESVWRLVDSLSTGNAKHALAAVTSLLSDREPPLKILALIARQLRMIAKMREALAGGKSDREACAAAGAPPFKARELKQAARRFRYHNLAHAFQIVAEVDVLLKSTKRPGAAVLTDAVLRICQLR